MLHVHRRMLPGLLATGLAAPALAQPWPSRPVTIVMPVAPGGPGDALGRPLANFMARELGQPVVVDARPGAGGTIGMQYAARSAPDGHTLVIASNSTYAIAPHLYPMPYDNEAAFAPVALLVAAPSFLCVHRDVPARGVADLVALARARPGQLSFATAGIGFTSHLATELFMARTGTELLHVPYRGGAPATQGLLAGEVTMNFMEAALVRSVVQTGMIRPLAITSAERSPLLPDVPTMREAGIEGFVTATYWAMMAPAGVPQPILDRVQTLALQHMNRPETTEAARQAGFVPIAGDAASFARHKAADTALWGEVIRGRNIRLG
ncbi:Bug family tripartite tricarboxylate transporter substrate binding protein [Rhodovarius lipocyclicus]|uniref:Bug family tripartite tricarboxylate transporter substrate binding protein n=1 Tax=Rhodovarius lipocyclicus TaxID=268410 RepID=UPI0013571FD8|nr:tripartite tricarboxylate transporter substrate binding protein [Rhodovarius lipocyclicus]